MNVLTEDIFELFNQGNQLSLTTYRGRFAPTPSGSLHLGNIRTAFASWLIARLQAGKWLLRIDDLDSPRISPESIETIQEDLNWLGLDWDGPVIFQSERIIFYESVISLLKKQNKLYACQCSRKLLSQVNNSSKEFIYPGTCRHLALPMSPKDGKKTSLRLKVSNAFSKTCGDIAVKRADGFIAYNFATVIDDLLLGINDVVRGEDLAGVIFSQLAVIDALNQRKLSYRHVSLLSDSDGKKLSKRNSSNSLAKLREIGIKSHQVIGWLAWSLGITPDLYSISALELLEDLIHQKKTIDNIFIT